MRTLVLNSGFEPVQLVSWQRALCLVLSSKAEIVAEYDHVVRSVSQAFQLPSVIRLKKYIRAVRRIGLARCTRKNVFIRDQFQCQYCGVHCRPTTITIDHVLPRSRGGKLSWDNVVAACHICNRRKGDRLPKEANMELLKVPRRPGWKELIQDIQSEAVADWLPYLDSLHVAS